MRVRSKIFFAVLLMIAVPATVIPQGRRVSASRHPSEALKAYVQNYLSGFGSPPDMATKIKVATVTTANGKAQNIVYVSGGGWCGSGGCTLLILEPTGSTFKLLGSVTIVQLPIRVLVSTNDGRPDIGVTVQGGGIVEGYEAVLSFDGGKYPSNPSMPPARKATAVQGKVIMADTKSSVPLYD
jgi:hypothetical protein